MPHVQLLYLFLSVFFVGSLLIANLIAYRLFSVAAADTAFFHLGVRWLGPTAEDAQPSAPVGV